MAFIYSRKGSVDYSLDKSSQTVSGNNDETIQVRSKHRVAMLARIISQSPMRTTESNGIIVPGSNEYG